MPRDIPRDLPHAWPGRTTPLAVRRLQRLVAADHPDRQPVPFRAVAAPLMLRVDPTHELPIELYEGAAMVARFAHAFDAAIYLMARGAVQAFTLPQPIADALAGLAGEADLERRLRRAHAGRSGAVNALQSERIEDALRLLEPDRAVVLTVDGDVASHTMRWEDFVDDNTDGDLDWIAIAHVLRSRELWLGGGGAGPAWTLRVAP